MFRAFQFGLCVVALLVMPAMVQVAGAVPIAVDTNTSAVSFDDDFETGTLGLAPTATVGTWQALNGGGTVATTGDIGFAPYEGSQLVNMTQGQKLYGQAAASSANGDVMKVQMAFRPSNMTQFGASGPTDYFVVLPVNSYFSSFSSCGELNELLFGDSGPSDVSYYNAGWHKMAQTFNKDAWNTITITHTNNGTDGYHISINGQTPEMVPYLGTSWDPAGDPNLAGIEWGVAGGTNQAHLAIDAIPGVVPEPSTLALVVTGLIGLLAYAWRKRR
jgi:hypothetical protein